MSGPPKTDEEAQLSGWSPAVRLWSSVSYAWWSAAAYFSWFWVGLTCVSRKKYLEPPLCLTKGRPRFGWRYLRLLAKQPIWRLLQYDHFSCFGKISRMDWVEINTTGNWFSTVVSTIPICCFRFSGVVASCHQTDVLREIKFLPIWLSAVHSQMRWWDNLRGKN